MFRVRTFEFLGNLRIGLPGDAHIPVQLMEHLLKESSALFFHLGGCQFRDWYILNRRRFFFFYI
jgi:hypothetical protein